MSFPLRSERPETSIRDEARILTERAGEHEDQLEALVAAAETHVRNAEAALLDALDASHGCIGRLRSLLDSQLQESLINAETARQLCLDAREQHVAADRLLRHLDDPSTEAQRPELRRDAVLVVDDYGDVREVLAFILEEAGFVVRTAANGLEALLAAYEMRPAVIVMDLTMPVLDGIEATRLIKAAEATRHAHVIACTGNGALGEGPTQKLFAAVLHKPTTPAVVVATVQHVAGL
jgi:two-component system, cell cycle response regulator DivK